MTHYDRLAQIARDLGLEPITPADSSIAFAQKLVAIVASHIEATNARLDALTPRKPGRPRNS